LAIAPSPAWKSIGAPAIVSVLTASGRSAAHSVASQPPWQSPTRFTRPPAYATARSIACT
jgi:hypothetical protein